MDRTLGMGFDAFRRSRMRPAPQLGPKTLIVHVHEDNAAAQHLCELIGAGRADCVRLDGAVPEGEQPVMLMWSLAASQAAAEFVALARCRTKPVTLCIMDDAPIPPDLADVTAGSLHPDVFERALARRAIH